MDSQRLLELAEKSAHKMSSDLASSNATIDDAIAVSLAACGSVLRSAAEQAITQRKMPLHEACTLVASAMVGRHVTRVERRQDGLWVSARGVMWDGFGWDLLEAVTQRYRTAEDAYAYKPYTIDENPTLSA